MHMPCHCRRPRLMTLTSLLLVPCGLLMAADPGRAPVVEPVTGPAFEELWRVGLRVSRVAEITSWSLAGGRVYAIGSDGVVHAIRTDNGHPAWGVRIADELDTIHPPQTWYGPEGTAVAFSRLHDTVILDATNGSRMHEVRYNAVSVGPAVLAGERAFVPEPDGRFQTYSYDHGVPIWKGGMPDIIVAGPLYVPAINTLVVASRDGRVNGFAAEDREERRVRLTVNFRAAPVGMAVDRRTAYVSTADGVLSAVNLAPEFNAEPILWQYRLPKPPLGNPTVTGRDVFQPLVGGGLQRVSKDLSAPAWLEPDGLQFLATWPQGAVIRKPGGLVAVVPDDPAAPRGLIRTSGFDAGISNTINDAVFLTSRRGMVTCIRPAGHGPLSMADFQTAEAAATRPAGPPATSTAPAEEAPEPAAEQPTAAPREPGADSDPLHSDRPMPR